MVIRSGDENGGSVGFYYGFGMGVVIIINGNLCLQTREKRQVLGNFSFERNICRWNDIGF